MTSTSEHPRFVVLEHHTDPEHLDLMLERTDHLWTWSCYKTELPTRIRKLQFEQIQDHRKKYLHFEGTVSGNRGRVQQLEKGTYRLSDGSKSEGRIEGRFDGKIWTFPFLFKKTNRCGRRNNPVWLLKNTES